MVERVSPSFLMKMIVILLVVVLLLDAIDAKPLKKSKSKNRKRNRGMKYCGTEGDMCQPGSRKLCCAPGFTCKVEKLSSNLTKEKRTVTQRIGFCKIVPVKAKKNKEIDDPNPNPKSHFRL